MSNSFDYGGHWAIKVNGDIVCYFQIKKGPLRQSTLINVVQYCCVDIYAILIEQAKVDGQIYWFVRDLVDDGLSIIIQYADDTII